MTLHADLYINEEGDLSKFWGDDKARSTWSQVLETADNDVELAIDLAYQEHGLIVEVIEYLD